MNRLFFISALFFSSVSFAGLDHLVGQWVGPCETELNYGGIVTKQAQSWFEKIDEKYQETKTVTVYDSMDCSGDIIEFWSTLATLALVTDMTDGTQQVQYVIVRRQMIPSQKMIERFIREPVDIGADSKPEAWKPGQVVGLHYEPLTIADLILVEDQDGEAVLYHGERLMESNPALDKVQDSKLYPLEIDYHHYLIKVLPPAEAS